MKTTEQKITLAGDILEHDVLGAPIFYGTNYHQSHKRTGLLQSSPEENALKSAYRAKAAVRRLVNANTRQWNKPTGKPYLPIFLTFTFRPDIRDITQANGIFTLFIKRFNYFVSDGVKKHSLLYITVIEFQDKNRDGVIHFHALFFNLPYIDRVYDEVKRVWQWGHVNVKSVRNIKDMGQYMVKYMTKSMQEGRLKGKKKYFTSRSLLKPVVIYESEQVEFILTQLPSESKVGTASWDNKYCKKITRTTYNIQNHPGAIDWIRTLIL